MPELPTLGEPPKKSPVPAIAVTALLVGAAAGGAYWWKNRVPEPAPAAAPAAEAAAPQAAPAEVPAPAPLAQAPAAAAPAAQPSPAPKGGVQTLSARIHGPLEAAIVEHAGRQVGLPLTQVVTRSLVWWVKVPQDLVKGDQLDVAWEERDGQEPLVHAVRYRSGKHGKTFQAFRFQAPGAKFARLYDEGGQELEEHLVDGPVDSWEQITSLLRDGRRHKGVDYKTPVGTPVKATFDGTVTRKNWNFRGNGNCVELVETGGQGRTALYLHLAELPKALQPGQRVKKGEVFAQSGNSGRSFAPHLHYQLMKGEKVVDPFEVHQTSRVALAPADLGKFKTETARLSKLLDAHGELATAAGAR